MPYYKESQKIFKTILTNYHVKTILVPTCDELLLSLVIDNECKIHKQAYFFQDSRVCTDEAKLYTGGAFNMAESSDIEDIRVVSGEFFDCLDKRVQNEEIFTFREKGELLGIGIVERGRILKNHASIGMFTNENYRKQGIGRTIIHNLKKWCYRHGLQPVCGCAYGNTASKHTLESAGMMSRTRLLNVTIK